MNKKIAKICMLIACCGGVSVAHAGDFQVTTIHLNAGDEFKFALGAAGTFTVDCGDGGTLSGDDVSGNTITKNNTDTKEYKCTYSTDGEKTIDFGGRATEYSTMTSISFANDAYYDHSCDKIAKIDGTLGNIFPILNNTLSFWDTFSGCKKLKKIPEDLFSGINGATEFMFANTFDGCKHLTSIPSGLFSGVNGAAQYMFSYTFSNCTSLAEIPSDLFSGINDATEFMFEGTFDKCSSLTSIPENLFSGVNGGAEGMFYHTFSGCTSLTGYIPKSTFGGLVDAGSPMTDDMWTGVFDGTNLLKTCPDGTTPVEIPYTEAWGGYAVCEPKSKPNLTPVSSGFDFGSIDTMLTDSFWKSSVWIDADGGFNTARLVSDSVASVVLGTVGGVVTSNIIKKNQLKNGLQTLKCTIGGQDVANMGDEFTVEVK